jgi:hypothetical protein
MTDLTPAHMETAPADGGRLHVGWFIPPFFHELPIDEDDPEEAARRLVLTAREVMANRTEDEQLTMALTYATLIDDLRAAGAVYAGFCVMDMDGRPSTASVAVYRQPLYDTTAEDAVSSIHVALSQAYPADDIRVTELPSAKGVVRIGDAPFVLPADFSPTGERVTVDRGQIQVYVPLPNDAEMVIFELSTPSMEDWDLYSEVFAEIVRTLDWGTEEDAAMAAALAQPPPAPAPAPGSALLRELYARSSLVLDTLALPGRMDHGNRLTAVTCADCWSKGLRSVCSARHEWQIDDADDGALAPAVKRFATQARAWGWTLLEVSAERVSAAEQPEDGYRITVAAVPGQHRVTVDVAAPCTRTVRGPADSVFG